MKCWPIISYQLCCSLLKFELKFNCHRLPEIDILSANVNWRFVEFIDVAKEVISGISEVECDSDKETAR